MPMTPAKTIARPNFYYAKCAIFFNGSGLKISHTLVLGSTNVALVQLKYSYNFSSKSPVTLNPGDIINSNTILKALAKDRSKAAL